MTATQFLQQIQPNVTVITALFAFLVLFIKLFWFFLSYEKTLRDENLSRLQELVSNEQEIQIVKPLQDELSKNIEIGYNYAISLLYRKQFNPNSGLYEHKLITDDEEISLIVKKEIKDIAVELSGQGIAQKSGQELFSYLEKRYQKTSVQINKYNKTKTHCQNTWICCIGLSALCVLGIILFVSDNNINGGFEFLKNIWIFSTFLSFVLGTSSFIKLFYNRHKLVKDWEKLKIYGE